MKNIKHLLFASLSLCSSIVLAQWNPQKSTTTNYLSSVHFTDTSHGWAVGDKGTALKTTDGGANWNAVNVGTTGPILTVQFVDSLHGFMLANTTITNPNYIYSVFKTVDGGKSWSKTELIHNYSFYNMFFIDSLTGWVSRTGAIFKTTDGGTTWTGYSANSIQPLNSVYFINKNEGWAAGGSAGSSSTIGLILKTINGGLSWDTSLCITNAYNNLYFKTICFTDSKNGYASGSSQSSNGKIVRTTDGGKTWVLSNAGVYNTGVVRMIGFANKSNGWLVADAGNVRRTIDGGTTWTSDTAGHLQLNGLCAIGQTAWAVAADGGIYKYEIATGIIEADSKTVSFGPNPFNGELNIETGSNQLIEIINASGVLVLSQLSQGDKTVIDTGNVPPGFYILKLGSKTKKIIKQ